jgi:hypothetical protein
VAWTALQLTAKCREFGDSWGLKLFKILLEAGVDVNGVCSDEAVIANICKEGGCESDQGAGNENTMLFVQERIQGRGRLLNYHTPLRILGKIWEDAVATSESFVGEKEYIVVAADLLRGYRAKSLHLFPIKGLLGYVEDDMKEFARVSAQKDF